MLSPEDDLLEGEGDYLKVYLYPPYLLLLLSFFIQRFFLRYEELFDYDYDSDEDWEEEEQGESLSDDEKDDKEEEDDYEVDNKFIVPHGYLRQD